MVDGLVKIHGKDYKTVAYRVNEFRSANPLATIDTELISADDVRVVMKATIAIDGSIVATGFAEEERGSSNINKTSALENAETSAVGRALAFFGLGGTEIASADEVANAIMQQKSPFKSKQIKTKYWNGLRDAAAESDSGKARELWDELSGEQQQDIWRELSSGQRSTIKSLLKATESE